ncbi:MAG: glycosyltransferase family 9 protein [Candidatus Obscuribacterales bacterium]|nr:glycosyltransferase family 9 protein [Cyanobacteria bacterium HKST-UBA01]MCB9468550.1 glycosyltransferase family 9 protein [Candidatus Obscuribacterales bacterium]
MPFPTSTPLQKNGKLLVINFGGIGDEILFLPTLECLRQALPGWKITLMLEPRSRSFAELTDLVDATIAFDIKKRPLLVSDLMDILFTIRNGGFDMVVSSGSSLMVSALLLLSGVPVRIGYRSNALAPLMLSRAVPLHREVYAATMYHSLAEGLCQMFNRPLPQSAHLPRLKADEASMHSMTEFLNDAGIKNREDNFVVLLHPGTSRLAQEKGIYKTWPAANWTELVESLLKQQSASGKALKVVLAGGPDDKEIIEEIKAKLGNLPVISAYGITRNLKELAALIELSDLFVCVDSAPMHVAVGLGKPLVALFGPTDPALLLPDDSRFSYVWDNKNGPRNMFDRKGVNLDTGIVFDAIKEKLS